jgi:hypothetical protein
LLDGIEKNKFIYLFIVYLTNLFVAQFKIPPFLSAIKENTNTKRVSALRVKWFVGYNESRLDGLVKTWLCYVALIF